MIELLVLIAIAYAGARGVESIAGTTDRRHDTKDAKETVAKVAASGPKDGRRVVKGWPDPAEPGGTFSAAAPRSAALGGKAAVPFAVIAETSSTMWKAIGEGYREQWAEIRAERRKAMAERAAKRKAEKKAAEAVAKAGPPPPFPPTPVDPAAKESPEPKPRTDPDEGDWFTPTKGPSADAEPDPVHVITAVPEPRTEPDTPASRRHLAAVPDAQNGDLMSSPAAIIPEIRTLDGLMNALTLLRAMCEMRAEEAQAIAADDLALSNRLDQIETELNDLEVDAGTRAEIDALRDTIHAQSQSAAAYGSAAKDAADLAMATAGAAFKSHGGIAEAVQSSPIEQAARAGYYER